MDDTADINVPVESSTPGRFPFAKVFMAGVKFFAVVSAVLGLYVVPNHILGSFSPEVNEFVITDKGDTYGAVAAGHWLAYHPVGNAKSVQKNYDFPAYFFNAAAIGDHLKISAPSGASYSRLIRDGHVISSAVTEWIYYGIALAIAGIFPLAVFLPLKHVGTKRCVFCVAALAEVAVMGAVLFVYLLSQAMGHNC
jgi:hypothetical protein